MGDAFSAIGSLADPLRRRLYAFVAGRDDGVGREEVAREVGVPAHTARFHLDKLVDEGLLSVDHRRLSGRSGPGAGRPAKVYRRSATRSRCRSPSAVRPGRALFAAAVERSLDGRAPDRRPRARRPARRGAATGRRTTGRAASWRVRRTS